MFGTPLGLAGVDKEACFIPLRTGVTRPFDLLKLDVLADDRERSFGMLCVLKWFAPCNIAIVFDPFCDFLLSMVVNDLGVGMLIAILLLFIELEL